MSKPYTPLFNRTYLTILVWFSAITVLILATQTGDDDFPQLETTENKPVYWTDTMDMGNQLNVLIPTPSALRTEDNTRQFLLKSLLEAQLASFALTAGSQYSTHVFSDHVAVRITWSSPDAKPAIKNLWDVLTRPVSAELYDHLVAQAQARSYIIQNKVNKQPSSKITPEQYIARMFAPLDTPIPSSQQLLTDLSYSTVTVMGEEAEDIADEINEYWPLSRITVSPRQAAHSGQPAQIAYKEGNNFVLIMGQVLSARANEQYLAERLAIGVVQLALAAHQNNTGLEYTIKFASLRDAGYATFSLISPYPIAPQLAAIRAQLTEDRVNEAKRHLLSSWQAIPDNPDSLGGALNRLAFYQLAPNALNNLRHRVEDLDNDKILVTAKRLLGDGA
ncbi:MAG: hypothetical protein ACPGPF_03940 [Pontibacterium sp.]